MTGLSVFKARVLKRKNVSLSMNSMFAHRYSSVTGRTLIMCRFARLNAAISVNLKPNEDGEYAEVQKHICHFCFYLLSIIYMSGCLCPIGQTLAMYSIHGEAIHPMQMMSPSYVKRMT